MKVELQATPRSSKMENCFIAVGIPSTKTPSIIIVDKKSIISSIERDAHPDIYTHTFYSHYT